MRVQLGDLPTRIGLLVLIAWGGSAVRADSGWRIAADTQAYQDNDNVRVVTPQVAVRYALDDEGSEVGARTAVDIVSAASIDVVSQASTRFHEIRTAVELDAKKAFGDHLPSIGYHYSGESDYVSHGGHAGWQTRLGTADSTLAIDYGLTFDRVGLQKTPRTAFSHSLTTHHASVSFTQVLGERTLARGVYTLTAQRGYLKKPYRYVPLFDQGSIERARANGERIDRHTLDRYRLPARVPEQVPDRRLGHAVALRFLQYVDPIHGSLRVDYQLYGDSFSVIAHVLEPKITIAASDHVLLSAFVRYYHQSAASFWRRTYVVPERNSVPRLRTADRELSSYDTVGSGLTLEWTSGTVGFYVQGMVLRTWFDNVLLLDGRLALVEQAGLRWTP